MPDLVITPEGHAAIAGRHYACVLGRSGRRVDKSEGDGATPIGRWPVRAVLYRADRIERPETSFTLSPISSSDGWCDDPGSVDYNRPVSLPHPARHEALWRDDALYDVVVILGYNDDPVVPGAGSAIFLHIARADGGPTEGCVALAGADLVAVLRSMAPGDAVTVSDTGIL